MNKKFSLLLTGILILLSTLFGNAQDLPTLGLLFSQTSPNGTARIQGLGGAQISLGGDISSLQSNPAGLGMFNRSSFSFSTGLSFINNNASYYGTNNDELKLNANIPNLGVVLQKEGSNKIRSHAFGISYNRIADYQNRFVYEGRNSESSMLDHFIQNADGTVESAFFDDYSSAYNSTEGLAVRTGLILPTSFFDPDNGFDDLYDSDILGNPMQRESIDVRGAQYQFNIGYGMNYNDILYLGANIGIKSVNYVTKSSYQESNFVYVPQDANDNYVNPLNSFELEEQLDISGGGLNTTFGLMYRPIDFIQIGAAFTSPTYFEFDEEFDRDMSADYKDYDDEYAESDIILASYSFTTPMKFSGGITFFAGKYGFITADAEMINYGKSKFSSSDFTTSTENSQIKSSYEKVYNYRIGGEFRIDIFRLRGGYALSQNGNSTLTPTQSFTGGVGVRYKHVSFDATAVNMIKDYNYSPYNFGSSTPETNVFQNSTKLIFSLGVYF